MRIALGIVKLFPEGGLQRDCIRLARILVARGHDVTIFTSENKWPFDRPPCAIVLLPVRAYTNHRLDLNFAKRLAAATADGFDRVVGFNKLTGLDFYYCGDPSILDRGRNPIERSLPRHRVQTMLEQEVLWAAAAHPNLRIDQIIGGELSPQLANPRTANHRAATVDRSDAPAA